MTEWKKCNLGDVADRIGMGPFGSNIKVSTFVDEGIPVISGTHLRGIRLEDKGYDFITVEHANKLQSANVYRGDVIFTHAGNIGQVAFIPTNSKFERYIISQRQFYLRCRKDALTPEFLTYYFKSNEGQYQLLANANQTGVPSLAQPVSYLKTIDIVLPPLPEQRAIAGVLSSLDDKIELLHRQNKTLEGMAEALWWKMFVEEADPGWKKGELGDLVKSVETGRRPKGGIDPNLSVGVPSIGAENINGVGNYEYSKTKYVTEEYYHKMNSGKIQNYDILIYKDGAYIGKKSMFANGFPFEQCCINEHVFILRTGKVNSQLFLYFALEQEELEQLNANSAQPGLNQEALKSFEIIIPPDDLINDFGEKAKILIDKIFTNSIQIRVLSRLRDTLLPKLMSGEMRVKYLS